ncbi:energy-coupling factor ABC transporter ATP-binding protein [Desulfosoma caldarium]|uniref:Cobalt/nickel transport system ATP-binding protein/biotin transport system ATP-binding protein n=1 Tax=Desulfosoma caldarium TaxID=610254 RepID=A0A3N1VLG5_9BACT|nr:ABC transporter ATP-binding protein [Desulfosoma caldarium]ROR01858.1 cobalt/nickel transport system ATP-binding protein/biotin transport system ATP-binding protein [Desulfosoma caldarium]
MIEAKDLHFTYPDGTRALCGVNFRLDTPVFVLLCGANGQGKTTLLYILSGLYEPTAGSVRVLGLDAAREARAVRRRVGLVFQDPDHQILGETVAEDVAFGLENLGLSRQEIRQRLNVVLAQFGLEALRDKPCYALSGGEKRRVALAGVLAMNPEVVLFDEPFTHLDWAGSQAALKAMLSLRAEGRTVVVSTHDVEKVMAHVEDVLVLEKGVVADHGPPPNVAPRLAQYGVRPPCSVFFGKGLQPWLAD